MKAQRIIDAARNGQQSEPLRPYGLQQDGDLWQVVHQAIVARGAHSIAVSKTTGHALEDEEYMRKHPERRVEAINNDRADQLADDA
eukprot:5585218-Karenia_brevis.AAC.1